MAYKTTSKHMQYISVKLASGMRVPEKNKGPRSKLSEFEKDMLREKRSLAKVRQIYELEKEIERGLAAGENIGWLKLKQQDLKSGRVPVDLRYADSSYISRVINTSKKKVSRKVLANEKARLSRPTYSLRDKNAGDKLSLLKVSRKSVEIDVHDLSKRKLTPSGIMIIKTLFEHLEIDEISSILKVPKDFLEKTQISPFYTLSGSLCSEDILMVVETIVGNSGTC
ncbi:hypothetical protein SAMN04488056_111191 [Cohaesibacter marisflavi]|uniref:Uncharacterized protein n=1 Tax=Cohaesibacter marisflavi TaxID=655353 RepID=A0A1I5JIV7_9HYPH|nr:hypothetical protein [Cohaesibacter marisflavi]SFO72754.1 hypothetical protein SAMN04488056_111191 [Cohaesibacter marisflavi]